VMGVRQGQRRLRKVSSIALAVVLVGLAACQGGAGGDGGGEATTEGPATLTFWSWVPGLEEDVRLFEKAHPDIDVRLRNVGQGADEYTKLRTALKAGEGAPDVVQIEFQYIPTFTQIDALVDLSQYGANEIAGDYEQWTWEQVSEGDAVYAIPQDSGPMGLLYRKDIFDRYGLKVPTTWEEYAAEAEKLNRANPNILMTNFAANDAGWINGLLWQAGARPFDVEGTRLSVNFDSPEAGQVMSYWGDLVERGLVDTTPDFTNEWYSGLAKGKYATWVTAAWGPVFLQGVAEQTSGKWRAAPMPQWNEGDSVSANWGGSTNAVTTQSDFPEQAAELAMWINHDPQSTKMLAEKSFLFPVLTDLLTSPSFQDQGLPFYGGQPVNQVFIESSNNVDIGFEWSPFQDYVYSQLTTAVGDALKGDGQLEDALSQVQEAVTSYAEEQGFTVEQ
jgi:multiple sugar transport system substrate-binding protein